MIYHGCYLYLETGIFLKNYREVLLKIYLDAGLSDLAKARGYQTNSICTNFKRTLDITLSTLFDPFSVTKSAP